MSIKSTFRKGWDSFRNKTALWIGVASIIFGIFSSIGVLYSVLAYNDTVKTNELLNRPYLNLNVPWFVFLDKNGREFTVGQNPDWNNVKYFRITFKVNNFGKLPAERTTLISTTTPLVLKMESNEKITIYDELKSESEIFPIEKLGNIFKSNSEFTERSEVKYHLPGSAKIYTAFSESRCVAALINTNISIKCFLIREGTS